MTEAATMSTDRLQLRPWRVDDMDDARALYRYASNPHVGPAAAWAVHTSVEDSLQVIRNVLSATETYAVVLKETGEPVGSIGLSPLSDAIDPDRREPANEREIGYWIGEPYWGRGLIPEAGREMLRHGFEDLHLSAIWGRHDVDNAKSARVMDKLDLKPVRTARHVHLELLGDVYRDEIIRRVTAEEWRGSGR